MRNYRIDKNWEIRKREAEQAKNLHKLVYDRNFRVRAAVARQGFGLDILIHDNNRCVQNAARLQMSILKEC